VSKAINTPGQRPWYFSAILGGVIYAVGDAIAAAIIGSWQLQRMIGIFAIGATLYAAEIKWYFNWIEKIVKSFSGAKRTWIKTTMALTYFNPLWIARHLLLIHLVSGNFELISWVLLLTGLKSFAVNIPLSIGANYWIQNKVSLSKRFYASAIFSGIMAVYYSMSSVWF